LKVGVLLLFLNVQNPSVLEYTCKLDNVLYLKRGIKMKKKNIIIGSLLCLVILFLGLISYSSKIMNPFIGIKGLILINSSDKDVVQISVDPARYLSKSNNVEGFVKYMTEKAYKSEQLGSSVSAFNNIKSLSYGIEGFFLSNYNIYTEFEGKK